MTDDQRNPFDGKAQQGHDAHSLQKVRQAELSRQQEALRELRFRKVSTAQELWLAEQVAAA
jgi:hypothetical protein